ncbi:MAG TPA: pyruvate kinase [Deltaproteobacteria bacterium]|nr:pyruvate kinase [Deltaproteobacteria bacterium]
MRKAKIVCTLGPATSSEKSIEALIANGMDVARLNFSHGDHRFHGELIKRIRKVSTRKGRHVAILQDLQGIKIRVGELSGAKVNLIRGETITIQKGDGIGDEKRIFISYPWLIDDAKVGDTILLDDGLIQLEIIEKQKESLRAKIIEGGILREKKGVNLPHMKVSAPSFTEKDKKDLEFGIKTGVDYVALSFVRSVKDVLTVKRWLSRRKVSIPLIAKIEKEEAIHSIDHILNETDGIMVARGDLGVEMPLEEVPMFQKMLIHKANEKRLIVITATQMLESMTHHSRPTRAETTDVANAVIDGTDALMLSAETSTGRYPVESLKVMDRIVTYTEERLWKSKKTHETVIGGNMMFDFPEAIARCASDAANEVNARLIVVFTRSGFTARLISKFRPHAPIIAFSPDEIVVRQLALYWGVKPHFVKPLKSTDELIREVDSLLIQFGYVKKRDRVIIVASLPPSTSGKTNFMKIHVIGEKYLKK